jgi:hypothetical protein
MFINNCSLMIFNVPLLFHAINAKNKAVLNVFLEDICGTEKL